MQNTILTVLFLLFTGNVICGQTSANDSLVIIDKPVTGKTSTTDLSELIGLTGQKAPLFAGSNMEGSQYNLENLRGKVVVINLWATFCAPCIEEMPQLNALVKKYSDKDVVFLAPTPDQKSALEGFLQKNSFKYQVLPNSFEIIRQYAPKRKVISPTAKSGDFDMILPAHLIIDRDGTVVKHFWGSKSGSLANELEQTIKQLLAKKKH